MNTYIKLVFVVSFLASSKGFADTLSTGTATYSSSRFETMDDDFDAQVEQAYDAGILTVLPAPPKPSFGNRILRRLGNMIAKVILLKQQVWKKFKR